MVAGKGERMLRLAARHGDAWNVWLSNCPEGLGPLRTAVDAACVEVGRNPATLERTVGVVADVLGRGVWSVIHQPAPRCWRGHPRR